MTIIHFINTPILDVTLHKFKENALSVAKQFDIEKILPLYEELYHTVINKFLQKI